MEPINKVIVQVDTTGIDVACGVVGINLVVVDPEGEALHTDMYKVRPSEDCYMSLSTMKYLGICLPDEYEDKEQAYREVVASYSPAPLVLRRIRETLNLYERPHLVTWGGFASSRLESWVCWAAERMTSRMYDEGDGKLIKHCQLPAIDIMSVSRFVLDRDPLDNVRMESVAQFLWEMDSKGTRPDKLPDTKVEQMAYIYRRLDRLVNQMRGRLLS